MADRCKEPRVRASLLVEVSGSDARGDTFHEAALATNLSRSGVQGGKRIFASSGVMHHNQIATAWFGTDSGQLGHELGNYRASGARDPQSRF